MPRTRRSTLGLAQLKEKSSEGPTASKNKLTPKKGGNMKKKRTVSDRSPAIVSRKKVQASSSADKVCSPRLENKENRTPDRKSAITTQQATPYWKVAGDRGTSPRITRSSSKRPCNIPRADEIDKCEISKGLFQLEFSPPPNEKEARKRALQIERQRDERLNQQRRQEGDVFFLSPNSKKKTTRKENTSSTCRDQNQFCLELSPEVKIPSDALVRAGSVASSITHTSSHFDELKVRCREHESTISSLSKENTTLSKENASFKMENTMLKKNLTKSEHQLEKVGSEKNRLMVEKAKLDIKVDSYENSEWKESNQKLFSRMQELEENVGKYKSDRSNSQTRAYMEDLQEENDRLRKANEQLIAEMKLQGSEYESALAVAKDATEATITSTAQLSSDEEKNAEKFELLSNQLKEKDAVLILINERCAVAEKKVEEFDSINNQLTSEHEQALARVKKEAKDIDSLYVQLKEKDAALATVEERCAVAEKKVEEFDFMNTQAASEHEEALALVKKEAKDIDSLYVQLKEKDAALATVEERCVVAEKKVEEFDSMNDKLKEKDAALATVQERCAVAEKKVEEFDSMNDELKEKDAALATVQELAQKKVEEFDSMNDELKEKDAALARVQERCAAAEKKVEEFDSINNQLASEHEATLALVKKEAENIDSLNVQLKEKDAALIMAEERTLQIKDAHKRELEATSHSFLEKLSEQEEEIKELCEQHELNEKDMGVSQIQIENIQKSLMASECKNQELQNELVASQMKVEESSLKNIELQANLQRLKEENLALSDKIKLLSDDVERYRQESDQMASQRDELQMTLMSEQSENTEKERRILKMVEKVNYFNGRESDLLQKIILQEELRRSLHNRVIQLSGNIRVFIRVRPCISSELTKSNITPSPFSYPTVFDKNTSSSSSAIKVGDDLTKRFIVATEPSKDRGGLSQRRKKMKFGFDNVFNPNSKQEDIWDATEPLVQSAVDGYNVCIFAYGQTGSGKTYTMLGGGDASNPGIITKAIKKLFDAKRMLEDTSHGETTVDISVELLEVYNEQVRDLMSTQKDNQGYKSLNISLNADEVIGNVVFSASDENEVLTVLSKAQERRCVKATKSNEESSRSHFIFTMNFVVKQGSKVVRKSKLHVCDLAGSERLSKSQATGSTLNETKHINKSLSTLSNVIENLQQKSKHVAFRESKLTYLLRNSLGGDSKTLAIVCCNPLAVHFQETSCSLRFAQKMNKVELQGMGNISC